MRLNFIKPFVPYLPEVKGPAFAPTLKEKLIWTGAVLALFFIMYHIIPFGAILSGGSFIEFIQVVLASKTGTLLTVGIGPIILASILLQLLAGAKIIEVDFSNQEDKANFSATQKVLAIALAFIESALFVLPEAYLTPISIFGLPTSFALLLVVFQVAFASIILLLLDEVVSKYGIGSGISLFIAAGVSLAIVQGSLVLFFGGGGLEESLTVIGVLKEQSATVIASVILTVLPLIFTFVIMLLSVYAENVRVEIPLAFDRIRGFGSRFPVKLLYVSVLPVILTSAMFVNIQLLSRGFLANAEFMIGDVNIVPLIGYVGPNGYLQDGLLYLMTSSFSNPLFIGYNAYLAVLAGSTPLFGIPEFIHIIIYAVTYITLCVFFGKFWIEAAGMAPSDIADQITKTGMQIPGFRRDPRIIKRVLEKYISTITIIGSIFVGFLAVFADLTGAIGSGTGVLLTVSIVQKFYEDLKRQKLFETYSGLQGLFGS